MWLEARLARQAEEYWKALPSGPELFPRELMNSASLALPLALRDIHRLSLTDVHRWLHSRGIADPIQGRDRRLRGCLIAYGGYGFVLIDGSDPADEKRFTRAHELAHFMLDYQEPRRRAIEALGEEIIPVLDSVRSPTRTERLHAVMSEVPIGLHLNLMERTALGSYISPTVLAAEERADRLALEMLAPAADAWAAVSALPEAETDTLAELRKAAARVLQSRFGLPPDQALEYGKWLLRKGGRRSGVRGWLGIVE